MSIDRRTAVMSMTNRLDMARRPLVYRSSQLKDSADALPLWC